MSARVRAAAAHAPLRVDLAGGFTDVPPFCVREGGFVVNVALTLRAHARVGAAPRGSAENMLILAGGARRRDAGDAPIDPADKAAPFRAALRESGLRGAALRVECDGPPSSGLGSSGAMLVAALAAVDAASGASRTPRALARRAREIEVEELGLLGGGQDPLAAALGGILAIRFGPGAGRRARNGSARRLRCSVPFVAWLEQHLVVADLQSPRASSARIERVVEKMHCADRRCLAALRAMRGRATDLAAAVSTGDSRRFTRAFAAHARELTRLEPTIFSGGVAEAIRAAKSAGAVEGKPCGAGGGGCVALLLGDRLRREAVESALEREGARVLSCGVALDGVRVG